MSTRSKIGIVRCDGSVDHIYCHWDGYPEHNGCLLFNQYNNINKINELIKNGDMSLLNEHIFPDPTRPHGFEFNEERQDDVCLFYNRDREEDWKHTCPRTSKNIYQFIDECKRSDCDYAYLFDERQNEWIFSPIPYEKETPMFFTSLKDELLNNNYEMNDSLKEDYIIFDGIEIMKDVDYYEFLDNYRNNSESYFEIKNMFDKKEYSKYIDGLKSYMDSIEDQKLKDRIEKNISDVEKYFKLDNDLEM